MGAELLQSSSAIDRHLASLVKEGTLKKLGQGLYLYPKKTALGTTQLYNKVIVFNRKRNGEFTLGGQKLFFQQWREAPKNTSKEFLLVEMLNRLNELAEDQNQVMSRLKGKLSEFNQHKLKFALNHYGNSSTQ